MQSLRECPLVCASPLCQLKKSLFPLYRKTGHALKGTKGWWLKGGISKGTARLSQTGNHLLTRVLLLLRYAGGTVSGGGSSIGFANSPLREWFSWEVHTLTGSWKLLYAPRVHIQRDNTNDSRSKQYWNHLLAIFYIYIYSKVKESMKTYESISPFQTNIQQIIVLPSVTKQYDR